MKKLSIALGILAVLMLLFLSQVIKFLPFRYLDFSDDPSVVVASYGGPDQLFFADRMPTSYRFDRLTYTVKIRVEFVSGDPRVNVTALDGETVLSLRAVENSPCSWFWSLDKGFKDQLTFLWDRKKEISNPICRDPESGADALTMSFRVRDQSGTEFDERLPFALVRNGYYLWIDGL